MGTTSLRRFAIVIVVVSGIVVATTGAGSSVRTAEAAEVERLAGDDRYDTAALLASAALDAPTSTVYVATGEGYGDALAAGPAAVADGAVLLFVRSEGPLPPATRDALERLDPDRIVVAGGAAAVSDRVAAALREFGAVERADGDDRYETAAALASRAFEEATEAFVVTGEGFADALAGGAVAAAQGAPVLLARPDHLPEATSRALDELGVRDVTVLGGERALSPETLMAIDATVDGEVARVAGVDRFDTAARLAERYDAAGTVLLATGRDFADALAAVPVAASLRAPLVLAEAAAPLPGATAASLGAIEVDEVHVLGGEQAVGEAVTDLVSRALAGEPVCVDLNAAHVELLTEIHGVGEVRAEEIVAGRPWDVVADLTEVSGIGEATLEGIVEQGLAQPACP